MEKEPEAVTPEVPAEQTVESKTAEEILAEKDAEIAELRKKEVELQAQKEHWRTKYDRDVVNTKPVEVPDDSYSEEGRLLRAEIQATNEKLLSIERKEARREAEAKFSVLKDKREEFDAFLEDSEVKGLSMQKAAKLFLAENGLLEGQAPRKGLEKPTGGGVTPPKQGYEDEELEDMRKNNYRKYEALMKAGKI